MVLVLMKGIPICNVVTECSKNGLFFAMRALTSHFLYCILTEGVAKSNFFLNYATFKGVPD